MSIAGSDNKIFIWNVGTAEVITEIDFPDIPLSASWNWDGSKLVATCKDKKIRLLNPRTGSIDKVISALSYIYIQILFFKIFICCLSFPCLSFPLSFRTAVFADQQLLLYRTIKEQSHFEHHIYAGRQSRDSISVIHHMNVFSEFLYHKSNTRLLYAGESWS